MYLEMAERRGNSRGGTRAVRRSELKGFQATVKQARLRAGAGIWGVCRGAATGHLGRLVRAKGLEPPRLAPPEPKSGVSTNSTTPATRQDAYSIGPRPKPDACDREAAIARRDRGR